VGVDGMGVSVGIGGGAAQPTRMAIENKKTTSDDLVHESRSLLLIWESPKSTSTNNIALFRVDFNRLGKVVTVTNIHRKGFQLLSPCSFESWLYRRGKKTISEHRWYQQ
jgi:hypothetical protein